MVDRYYQMENNKKKKNKKNIDIFTKQYFYDFIYSGF